jgi:hypothetical protein
VALLLLLLLLLLRLLGSAVMAAASRDKMSSVSAVTVAGCQCTWHYLLLLLQLMWRLQLICYLSEILFQSSALNWQQQQRQQQVLPIPAVSIPYPTHPLLLLLLPAAALACCCCCQQF